MSQTNYVRFKQGQLWTEAFGQSFNSAILLIAGAEKQAIYWSDSWCNALAQMGYYVIRFDHRDTGLSSHIDFNAHPYRLQDLAQDILLILDFYKKERAHLIGSGMGGYLVQMLAISHPEKVSSLVLLMTTHSATLIEQKRKEGYQLPATSHNIYVQLERVSRILHNDPHWLSKTLYKLKLLNGACAGFDEIEWESFVMRLKNRMRQEGVLPIFYHHHLLAKTLSNLTFESHCITQPTLIVHGDSDPLISIEYSYTTKNLIPHSELMVVKKMGHLLNPCFEDQILKEICKHLMQCNKKH